MTRTKCSFFGLALLVGVIFSMAVQAEVPTAIPEAFRGSWVEVNKGGRQQDKIKVTDGEIVWERAGAPLQKVPLTELKVSSDSKTISFSSKVVVAQSVFIPVDQLAGRASVRLTREKDELVLKVSGIKLKQEGAGGLYEWKGGTSITFEVINGREIAVIELPPEVHRYRKR
jgi:hypothetical protein